MDVASQIASKKRWYTHSIYMKGAAKTSATLAKMGGGALCTGGGGIVRGKVMCQIIDTGVNAVVNGAAIVTANYYHSESKN